MCLKITNKKQPFLSSKYILCFIYLVYVIQCTLICTLRANQNISLWTHQVYINLGDKNSPFFQSMTCLSIQLALYNQWQQKSVKRYMHIFIRSNCYATKRALNARSIKISRFRFSWKLKFEITNGKSASYSLIIQLAKETTILLLVLYLDFYF